MRRGGGGGHIIRTRSLREPMAKFKILDVYIVVRTLVYDPKYTGALESEGGRERVDGARETVGRNRENFRRMQSANAAFPLDTQKRGN